MSRSRFNGDGDPKPQVPATPPTDAGPVVHGTPREGGEPPKIQFTLDDLTLCLELLQTAQLSYPKARRAALLDQKLTDAVTFLRGRQANPLGGG